jgi:hypothetical protein
VSFPKRKAPHSVRVLHSWIDAYGRREGGVPARLIRGVSFMVVAMALDRVRDENNDPLFVIKGGVAMELRLGLRSRATKDLDAIFRATFSEWLDRLDQALAEPVADFTLSRTEPEQIKHTRTQRLEILLDYRGRRWARVQLEVAPAEAADYLVIDYVPPIDISQFGLPGPERVPIAGISYMVAQKLHSCTEILPDGIENDRFRDLIDLLLCRALLEAEELPGVRATCVATFAERGKHTWHPEVTVFPSWPEGYRALADEEGFEPADVEQAAEEVRQFIQEIDDAEEA